MVSLRLKLDRKQMLEMIELEIAARQLVRTVEGLHLTLKSRAAAHRAIRDRLDEETLAVLNDDQRAQWRKRTGPACETIPKRIPGMSLTF